MPPILQGGAVRVHQLHKGHPESSLWFVSGWKDRSICLSRAEGHQEETAVAVNFTFALGCDVQPQDHKHRPAASLSASQLLPNWEGLIFHIWSIFYICLTNKTTIYWIIQTRIVVLSNLSPVNQSHVQHDWSLSLSTPCFYPRPRHAHPIRLPHKSFLLSSRRCHPTLSPHSKRENTQIRLIYGHSPALTPLMKLEFGDSYS